MILRLLQLFLICEMIFWKTGFANAKINMGLFRQKWRYMPHLPPINTTPPPPPSKKLICISPGGLKGFYLSGIIAYIKDNYDVSDFIFSGASAGSWNAILFTFRGNLTELIYRIIENKPVIPQNETIRDFKYYMKDKILEHYTAEDFDLARVFIGVTTLNRPAADNRPHFRGNIPPREEIYTPKFWMKTSIYSNFSSLEDALDCCIASSHIPFFMGRVFHVYNNQIAFDGGFSNYPYHPLIEPTLNITPTIWNRAYTDVPSVYSKRWKKQRRRIHQSIDEYTILLDKELYNFIDLFHSGYNDTAANRATLDRILPRKNPWF